MRYAHFFVRYALLSIWDELWIQENQNIYTYCCGGNRNLVCLYTKWYSTEDNNYCADSAWSNLSLSHKNDS